jgi:hypothetical protein
METDGAGSESCPVVDFCTACTEHLDSTSRVLFIFSNSNGNDRVKQKARVYNQHHKFLNGKL